MTKLVLLPGMDGTGTLFSGFVDALPKSIETVAVRYPVDKFLSTPDLLKLIHETCPPVEPYVLVAESFSSPFAIQYAAAGSPNLQGLVLCAGFATSPLRGFKLFLASLLTPILFRIPLPEFAAKRWLIGANATRSLTATVRAAIGSVEPRVLAARAQATLSCDVRPELSRVKAPLLYIRSMQDRLVNASCLKDILQIKPETIVAAIDGPHLLFQRIPEHTADIVKTFVQQLDGCSTSHHTSNSGAPSSQGPHRR